MLRCYTRFESFLAQTPLGAKLALVNQPHYKAKPWGQNKKNNTHKCTSNEWGCSRGNDLKLFVGQPTSTWKFKKKKKSDKATLLRGKKQQNTLKKRNSVILTITYCPNYSWKSFNGLHYCLWAGICHVRIRELEMLVFRKILHTY